MPRVTRITLELPGDLLAGRSREEICGATFADLELFDSRHGFRRQMGATLSYSGPVEVFDITVEDREIGESRESVAESAAKRAEMPQDRSEGMDSGSPSS